MSDQSTSEFEQLKQKPIFMEIMRQGPRDAAKVEAVLCAVLESVLEACEQDGLTMDQTKAFLGAGSMLARKLEVL